MRTDQTLITADAGYHADANIIALAEQEIFLSVSHETGTDAGSISVVIKILQAVEWIFSRSYFCMGLKNSLQPAGLILAGA